MSKSTSRHLERNSHDDAPMIDGFGRRIDYVRISVTDRCDLRCNYCMAEDMTFLPKRDLLSHEEIIQLADILIARGVRKIRLTGGEPLVRRGIDTLIAALGKRLGKKLGEGLEELTLTTNGTQLARFAGHLADCGVQRVNVSLDTLDADKYRQITRRGDIGQVLGGIKAAKAAGLQVKINMVAMAGENEHEIGDMLRWCGGEGHDLTLIEAMPLGEVQVDREAQFLSLETVRQELAGQFNLIPSLHRSGGPARYDDVSEFGTQLGFITPLSQNFCSGCNRIRITSTGTVFGCLGHAQNVELRDVLRNEGAEAVKALFDRLVAGKPERHSFDVVADEPAVERHMSVTGG